MDELMDMIATEESPSEISDKIKEFLFSKADNRINDFKPAVADILFNVEKE